MSTIDNNEIQMGEQLMREDCIYRGKASGKDWAEGHLIQNPGGSYIIQTYHDPEGGWVQDSVFVCPDTICRSTGKRDRKGKMIFENDIVAFEDSISTENGFIEEWCEGTVVWSKKMAMFLVTGRMSAESYEVLDDCEVIGDVFDRRNEKL